MTLQSSIKKAAVGAAVLLLGLGILRGAGAGDERAGVEKIVEGEADVHLVLKSARVTEVPLFRSASRNFVLERVNVEVVAGGVDPGPELSGESGLPSVFALSQNFPNPFNPTTTILFDVPGEVGEKKRVRMSIYDIRGRLVRTLVDSELEPGTHRVVWNGESDRRENIASGVYLYRLEGGEKAVTRKMTILQ